jgi:hypothetical protein
MPKQFSKDEAHEKKEGSREQTETLPFVATILCLLVT